MFNESDDLLDGLDTIDEDESIKKSTEALIDLQNVYDEMKKLGGVDSTIAASIEAIDASLINKERYPLGSFTKQPSQTNYIVALEGAMDGINNIIKGIFNGIMTVLKKIWGWIYSVLTWFGGKKDTGAGRSILRSIEVLKEMETLAKKSDKQIVDRVFKDMSDIAKPKLEAIHSDFLSSVIGSGSVAAALMALGGRFDTYTETINTKLGVLGKAIDVMKKDPENQRDKDILELMSQQQKPVMLQNAQTLVDQIVGKRTAGTLAETLPMFKEKLTAMTGEKNTPVIEYKKLYMDLLAGKIRTDDMFIKNVDRSSNNADKVLKKLEGLDGKIDKIKGSRDLQTDIRNACTELRRECQGLAIIIGSIKLADSHYTKLAHVINELINQHYKTLREEVNKAPAKP